MPANIVRVNNFEYHINDSKMKLLFPLIEEFAVTKTDLYPETPKGKGDVRLKNEKDA